LCQLSFTRQASNESEISGPGKKKPKVMRQQSTEKYLLGRTGHGFTLKVQIVPVEFAAYLTNVYTAESRLSLFYDQ
jgi:hypothetical protein